nr:MarR family winged helix-turn-helix transcriptional regulator [uncultured Methanobacterium sp.]
MDETEVFKCWKHLNRQIHLKHHEIAQSHGLTLEQFHLLLELDELELDMISDDLLPPTIGELAADIGNAPHTLSGRIKRLEKKGLIKKIQDDNDLRINRVVFTENGQELINTIKKEAHNAFIQNALKKMNKETLDNFFEGLKELNKNLSS